MSKPSLEAELAVARYNKLSEIHDQRMQLTDEELQEFDSRLDVELLTELEEEYD